jgi:hypothetical protein
MSEPKETNNSGLEYDKNETTILETQNDETQNDETQNDGLENETLQLNNVSESEQLSTNEEKQKQLIQLIKDTGGDLIDITANLQEEVINIDEASKRLLDLAAKLKNENPLKGGKSRRKAYKNKKKNKTKKGGRKSKKNQKNKR